MKLSYNKTCYGRKVNINNLFRFPFWSLHKGLTFCFQCTHVVLDNADFLSQYQLDSIRKKRVHIASPEFIWDCIKERRLLDVKNYEPTEALAVTLPPDQNTRSSGRHHKQNVLWHAVGNVVCPCGTLRCSSWSPASAWPTSFCYSHLRRETADGKCVCVSVCVWHLFSLSLSNK